MKKTLILGGIAIAIGGISLVDVNPDIAKRKGEGFKFDEKIVEKVVPNNEEGTMTIYLKDGKTKTYPFSWNKVDEFQSKANKEFIKPIK